MGLFKKKIKIDSKFKIDEFVGFHMDNDLKHGAIKNIRLVDGIVLYDINVGGEASWIAKNIKEENIIKIQKGN